MEREYLIVAGGHGGEACACHMRTQRLAAEMIKGLHGKGWRFFKLLRLNRDTGYYVENESLKSVVHKTLQNL